MSWWWCLEQRPWKVHGQLINISSKGNEHLNEIQTPDRSQIFDSAIRNRNFSKSPFVALMKLNLNTLHLSLTLNLCDLAALKLCWAIFKSNYHCIPQQQSPFSMKPIFFLESHKWWFDWFCRLFLFVCIDVESGFSSFSNYFVRKVIHFLDLLLDTS